MIKELDRLASTAAASAALFLRPCDFEQDLRVIEQSPGGHHELLPVAKVFNERDVAAWQRFLP